MVCLQTAVIWDMLTTSFTSWLSQELSYSQTCVVTIKPPQISMMKTDTHLSELAQYLHLKLINRQTCNITLHLVNIVTFSLAPALLLDSGLLSAVWRRGAQLDNWITITNQCWVPPPPPLSPWSLYPDTDTSTSHHTEQLSTSTLTEKLDIFNFIASESEEYNCYNITLPSNSLSNS